MDYVYVVTYSKRGSEEGQFDKEVAYVSVEDAEKAAFNRMEKISCELEFSPVDDDNHEHVVKRWDSSDSTVWLERLLVEGD